MGEWKNDYHSALKDLEIGFVSLKINHWVLFIIQDLCFAFLKAIIAEYLKFFR